MTKNESFIDALSLREMLSVDERGNLVWLMRPANHFRGTESRSQAHAANNWNSRYTGKQALTCVDASGHLQGRINGRLIYAHRAVWAIHYGTWPDHSIDHINGDPSDNRIENLRDVPHVANMRNTSGHRTNTSGVNGVSRYKRHGNWVASITVNGKSIHLGYFNTVEEAAAARAAADARYGFHENHGRRAA